MRILDAVCLHISVHYGIDGKPGYRFDAQFFGDILPVTDNGSETDVQFVGYFLVDESFGNKHQYLNFTG